MKREGDGDGDVAALRMVYSCKELCSAGNVCMFLIKRVSGGWNSNDTEEDRGSVVM
jgi:hypothetical protein